MAQSPSDAEVITQVLDGDVEAFGLLLDRYQEELAAYARYMIGNADEAADVVQESLVRAFRALRRCKDRGRFKGWLFRILSNQCKTHLARRRRWRRESLASLADQLPAVETANGAADAAELRRRVHEALQELSVDQREALVLKYVHGMNLAEMARLLSTTEAALKMRLLRGREALRERLRGVAL